MFVKTNSYDSIEGNVHKKMLSKSIQYNKAKVYYMSSSQQHEKFLTGDSIVKVKLRV